MSAQRPQARAPSAGRSSRSASPFPTFRADCSATRKSVLLLAPLCSCQRARQSALLNASRTSWRRINLMHQRSRICLFLLTLLALVAAGVHGDLTCCTPSDAVRAQTTGGFASPSDCHAVLNLRSAAPTGARPTSRAPARRWATSWRCLIRRCEGAEPEDKRDSLTTLQTPQWASMLDWQRALNGTATDYCSLTGPSTSWLR